jgi:hypothetical protein
MIALLSSIQSIQSSCPSALPVNPDIYYLDRLGWAAGFAQKLTSYCFRRGTSNAVDGKSFFVILFIYTDGFVGAATTAVCDQVLRHNPQTRVFYGSYINEKVRFIVQDAVLDQLTDAGFLCAFTHMSLTCDPRALETVPDEITAALPPDPEITELVREREEYRLTYGYFS